MREKIVAGNWKMNKTLEEGKTLASEIVNMYASEVNNGAKAILCTPFIHLTGVKGIIGDTKNVFLGAQNCNDKESGAYTGETSIPMLKSVGVNYVIIGHSERREYYNESDEFLAKKVDAALAGGITPIFCCGEPLDIREAGTHFDYVTKQLTASLFHLSPEQLKTIVIAYEPIWAIGTGMTATSAQAQEMHEKLRAHLAGKYGNEIAEIIPILYGGSCKPDNANEIFAGKDVDGGLIGGASLKSRDFIDIIKAF